MSIIVILLSLLLYCSETPLFITLQGLCYKPSQILSHFWKPSWVFKKKNCFDFSNLYIPLAKLEIGLFCAIPGFAVLIGPRGYAGERWCPPRTSTLTCTFSVFFKRFCRWDHCCPLKVLLSGLASQEFAQGPLWCLSDSAPHSGVFRV